MPFNENLSPTQLRINHYYTHHSQGINNLSTPFHYKERHLFKGRSPHIFAHYYLYGGHIDPKRKMIKAKTETVHPSDGCMYKSEIFLRRGVGRETWRQQKKKKASARIESEGVFNVST